MRRSLKSLGYATVLLALAACGKHEAVELRDGDERYGGKGVMQAVQNIEETIAPAALAQMGDWIVRRFVHRE